MSHLTAGAGREVPSPYPPAQPPRGAQLGLVAPCPVPSTRTTQRLVHLQAEAGQVVTPMDGIQHPVVSQLARPAGQGGGWLARPGMPGQGGRGEPRPAPAAPLQPTPGSPRWGSAPPAPPHRPGKAAPPGDDPGWRWRGLLRVASSAARGHPALASDRTLRDRAMGVPRANSWGPIYVGAAGGALGASWLCC